LSVVGWPCSPPKRAAAMPDACACVEQSHAPQIPAVATAQRLPARVLTGRTVHQSAPSPARGVGASSRRPLAMTSLRPIFAAVVRAALTTGCPEPDAEGKYKGFLKETEDEREDAANIKMDQGGALADVSGDFLFALAAVIDPAHPLQFYTTVTFTPTPAG